MDEKAKEYKEHFDMFDRDKDGLIKERELGNILRSLGHNPTEKEIAELFTEFDTKRRGFLTFEEFYVLMNKSVSNAEAEVQLTEAFRTFDKEGNGFIAVSDLKHIMTTLGEKLTDDEAEEMISNANCDKEGNINYSDFVRVILYK